MSVNQLEYWYNQPTQTGGSTMQNKRAGAPYLIGVKIPDGTDTGKVVKTVKVKLKNVNADGGDVFVSIIGENNRTYQNSDNVPVSRLSTVGHDWVEFNFPSPWTIGTWERDRFIVVNAVNIASGSISVGKWDSGEGTSLTHYQKVWGMPDRFEAVGQAGLSFQISGESQSQDYVLPADDTPEVIIPEIDEIPLETFHVYEIKFGQVIQSTYVLRPLTEQQIYRNQNKLVYSNEHVTPSDEFVYAHYGLTLPTPTPTPEEEKSWWWVTYPNGEIRQLNVTQNFVDVNTEQNGWIFTREKPTPAEPTPEPTPEPTIPLPNTGMIAQSIGTWEICPCEEGNRIYGKINFIANSSEIWENYYGKSLVHILQISKLDGTKLVLKTNNLSFTATERDEVLTFDESTEFNTEVVVESFVWLSTQDMLPFTNPKMFSVTQQIENKIDPLTGETVTLCKSDTCVKPAKRDDWLSKGVGLFGGLLGLSLLITGVKKLS